MAQTLVRRDALTLPVLVWYRATPEGQHRAQPLFTEFCQDQSHDVAPDRMRSHKPLTETPELVGSRPFGALGAFWEGL